MVSPTASANMTSRWPVQKYEEVHAISNEFPWFPGKTNKDMGKYTQRSTFPFRLKEPNIYQRCIWIGSSVRRGIVSQNNQIAFAFMCDHSFGHLFEGRGGADLKKPEHHVGAWTKLCPTVNSFFGWSSTNEGNLKIPQSKSHFRLLQCCTQNVNVESYVLCIISLASALYGWWNQTRWTADNLCASSTLPFDQSKWCIILKWNYLHRFLSTLFPIHHHPALRISTCWCDAILGPGESCDLFTRLKSGFFIILN